MKRIKLWLVPVFLLLLALPTGAVFADCGGPVDRIVPGEDYVLENGETERGNVVVFGGSAEIEEGEVVVPIEGRYLYGAPVARGRAQYHVSMILATVLTVSGSM